MPETRHIDRRLAFRRTAAEIRSMSVYCRAHPLALLRPSLADEGVTTAAGLRRTPSGRLVRLTGLKVIVHTPPVKSGRRVMFITMEDETGLSDVVVFERVQQRAARAILTSQVLTVAGRLERRGAGGKSVSVIVERVIPAWTGDLLDLLSAAAGPPRL